MSPVPVTTNDGDEGRELTDAAVPNVKLYVVVACIIALVVVAIIQVSPHQPSGQRG